MRAFGKMRGHIPLEKMKKCRDAAYSYAGIKIILALLTFYFIPCASCGNTARFFFKTFLHIVIIGHFISIGLPIAMRLIMFTTGLKTCLYLLNFMMPINYAITFPMIGEQQVLYSDRAFNTALLIEVFLCCFIVFMLIRAKEELTMLKKEKLSNA